MASGDALTSLSFSFHLGKTTVSNIISETTAALWIVLKEVVFVKPKKENRRKIASEFQKKWNFANCIGAIDGRHISMQAPGSGSEFFNYLKYHSIVLLGVCDANYIFTMVDIGASGRQSDGGILKNSVMYQKILDNSLDFPAESYLPGSIKKLNYVLVGDEAIPLTNYLMRPYPGRRKSVLPADIRVFNYRLSRTRRIIENTYGIMVSRWRLLRRDLINTTENAVKSVVCLYNWLQICNNHLKAERRQYCPINHVDQEDLNTGLFRSGEWRNETDVILRSIRQIGSNHYSQNAAAMRDTFKTYFMNEGAVPWQWKICNVNFNEQEFNL